MKITTLSLFLALTLLTGCGIKPDGVSAPPGVEKDEFPHTYPAPNKAQP